MLVSERSRTRRWLGLLLVAALAGVVRLWPAPQVFDGGGVQIAGDGDAAYHVLRAQQIAADWPNVPWFDPYLDYPIGAVVPWPPLFDEVIATASVVTPGGARPDHVARVAAMVPVVFAVATVPLLVGLSAGLVGGGGLGGAFLASSLPASVYYGYVGLADHHVAELFFLCATMLSFYWAWRGDRVNRVAVAALAASIGLSFWNWPGSALYLVVLVAVTVANHLMEPEGPGPAGRVEVALAGGSILAALFLAASVALLGPPGAILRMDLTPITGLPTALCLAVAGGSAALLVTRRYRRSGSAFGRRAGEALLAAAAGSAVLVLIPGARGGIEHGIMAASAANPWYETIAEFGAALFSRQTPLKSELLGLLALTGLCLAALPAGCWAVARRWRKNPGTRQALVLLIVWFSLLLMLSAARVRFMIYVSAPLGIVSAFGVSEFCRSTANRLAGRHSEVAWRGMTVAGLLLLLAPAYWLLGPPAPAVDPLLASVARWIALAAPPNAVVRGVLAPWAAGHSLRVSGLPVVGSPFGTDVSRASMEDEGTFYATLSEREAEDVLSRRRVGYVMVHWPLSTVGNIQAYFGGSRSVIVDRSLARGRTLEPASTFAGTVAARLFYADGMPLRPNDGPSLGGLRLLREELPPQSPGVVPREQVKLFGVVRGVRLVVSGLLPGTRATATVPILTNQGRTFLWQTSLIGDTGSVVLRVPYATGANGEVRARPCTITDGLVSRTLDVPEDAVVSGTRLDVALR